MPSNPALRASETTPTTHYTLWAGTTTFRKDGTPVLGTMGRTAQRVVIMPVDEFTRMIGEHPTLRDAQFDIGDLDG